MALIQVVGPHVRHFAMLRDRLQRAMQGNAHRALRHAESVGYLAGSRAFDGDGLHDVALPPLQARKDALGIDAIADGRLLVHRKHITDVIDRHMHASAAPAQIVDQLVLRNGPHPGQQRLALVPGVPLQMYGQQRFLHHVLDLFRTQPVSGKATSHQPAQNRRKAREHAAISTCVTTVGSPHQLRPVRGLVRHAATVPDTHAKAATLQPVHPNDRREGRHRSIKHKGVIAVTGHSCKANFLARAPLMTGEHFDLTKPQPAAPGQRQARQRQRLFAPK